MYWADAYPHKIIASVSLSDGKITGWKIGQYAMDCGSSHYGGGEIITRTFQARNDIEHNHIFENSARDWFKNWPVAANYCGSMPY